MCHEAVRSEIGADPAALRWCKDRSRHVVSILRIQWARPGWLTSGWSLWTVWRWAAAGFGRQSWQEAHRRQVASAEDALFGADGRGGEPSAQLRDRAARRRAV